MIEPGDMIEDEDGHAFEVIEATAPVTKAQIVIILGDLPVKIGDTLNVPVLHEGKLENIRLVRRS